MFDIFTIPFYSSTPLHYVAWSNPPCFQSAKLLLKLDAKLLLVKDKHGKLPLDFVRKEFHEKWIEFLESMKDELWPDKLSSNGAAAEVVRYCPEARKEIGMKECADMLCVKLAKMVANGMLSPDEAQKQQELLKKQQEA